jgi:hypothetical protein
MGDAMPEIDEVLMLERQSERLGVLWRSQGQEFLEEQATALQDDVERLRAAYLADAGGRDGVRPRRRTPATKVIDLTDPDPDVILRVCRTDGHSDVPAAVRCSRCRDVYCSDCILRSRATHDKPLCTECALIVSGVHHKRTRPLVAPGRAKR